MGYCDQKNNRCNVDKFKVETIVKYFVIQNSGEYVEFMLILLSPNEDSHNFITHKWVR